MWTMALVLMGNLFIMDYHKGFNLGPLIFLFYLSHTCDDSKIEIGIIFWWSANSDSLYLYKFEKSLKITILVLAILVIPVLRQKMPFGTMQKNSSSKNICLVNRYLYDMRNVSTLKKYICWYLAVFSNSVM